MSGDHDQHSKPAGSVRHVGALASLGAGDLDGNGFATVALRLFASTDGGDRVLDPQPVSTSLRIDPSKLAGLELSVQMSLRLRQSPTGARREAWDRIAAQLAERGITTDADTLHRFGFSLVRDDELQAAQAQAAG